MSKGIPFHAFFVSLILIAFAVSGAEAQSASAEKTVPFQSLSLDFDGLTDFGSGAQGFGQVASLAYSLRGEKGSFGLSLGYLNLPASMTDLPLGTFGSARIGYAAPLGPGFSAGAGLSGAIGDNGGLGWNLALDLGIEHFAGDLRFLKEFSWGFSLSGLGVSGGIPLPALGMYRSMPKIGIDPVVSAKLAMHSLLVRREGFRMGLGLGIVAPGLTDIGLFSSLDMAFGEGFSLLAGWDIGWKDCSAGTKRSLLPSLSLSASIPLGRPTAGSALPESSPARISTRVAYEPLYGQLAAVAGSLSYAWGSPVAIRPEMSDKTSSVFISPNGDGIQDRLEIPLAATHPLNAGALVFCVREKNSGTLVHIAEIARNHPDSMQKMRPAGDTLALVHAGIDLPRSLIWDGTMAGGAKAALRQEATATVEAKRPATQAAPDGEYIAGFIYRAIDGPWIRDYEGFLAVIIDRRPPEIAFSYEGDGVFSPDGDGRKDSLVLHAAGSKEATWKLEIFDSSGAVVASEGWADSVPADFVWKGRDGSGTTLPDGRYSARLSGKDRAGNSASRTLEGIRIDTRSPKATLDIDSLVFSPNGDGVKDSLAIRPWLESDEDLAEFRISVLDSSGFELWSTQDRARLASGQAFTFEGRTGKGDPLLDGSYRAALSLEYGNGYKLIVYSPVFQVDTSLPEAKISIVDAIPVFSPDGDGQKDTIAFSIVAGGGSQWRLRALDVGGKAFFSRSFQGLPPPSFLWDGKDDSGAIVPDGEYRLELSGMDEAGNVATALSGSFVVDLSRPVGSLLCDPDIFSPDGDGILETINLLPRLVPAVLPSVWSITLRNAAGTVVRRQEGKTGEPLPEKITLDGKYPATGKAWEDGRYRATLVFSLRNGFAGEASSPWFSLDTSPPEAFIQADRQAINPSVPGAGSRVRFTQTGTAGDLWKGELSNSDGLLLRVWDFDAKLPSFLEWDGSDSGGMRLADGSYDYRLKGSDAAGHSYVSRPIQVAIDTDRKAVSLSVEPSVFSPDGDGVGDTVNFGITTTSRVKSSSYALEVLALPSTPAQGSSPEMAKSLRVRSFAGKGEVPKSIIWNGIADSGAKAANGDYAAKITVSYPNGDQCESRTVEFSLDTNKPKVFVKADASSISPDGDGFMDEVGFTLIVDRNSRIMSWSFSIVAADKSEKILFRRSGGDVPGRLVWDGRDETGVVVRGQVFGRLAVVYLKGDIAQASSGTILVEEAAPKLEVIVLPDFFSPDGDGIKDMVTFLVTVDDPSRVASWRLEVLESASGEGLPDSREARERLFRVWSGNGAPPVSITWDGKNPGGEKVEAASDYPFRMRIRDFAGKQVVVSGIIAVDVLVVREGSRIRINIPSIEFRASLADFSGLAPQSEARNQKVLSRLVQILSRFPDYRIRIEGHANNEGKINGLPADKVETEEKGEIVPLSLARASFIRDLLVARGFDSRRFTVAGLGSSLPAVDPKDPATRWKNRRVEFILVREP